MDQQQIKALVIEDIASALDELDKLLADRPGQATELIQLKYRHTALERDNRLGVLNREQYAVEKNRLSLAFLEFVDALDAPQPFGAFMGRSHPLTWQQMQPFYIQHFDIPAGDLQASNLLEKWKIWQPYQDLLWSGSLENGCFVLRNETDNNAVKYHFIQLDKLPMADIPVSVEVKSNPAQGANSLSGAGLLFGFDETTRFYNAFIIAGNQFGFFRRGEHGFQHLYSARSPHLRADDFNRLALVNEGPFHHLYINDHYVKALRDDQFSGGHSGVIALSTGEFFFDNLTFYK